MCHKLLPCRSPCQFPPVLKVISTLCVASFQGVCVCVFVRLCSVIARFVCVCVRGGGGVCVRESVREVCEWVGRGERDCVYVCMRV